MTTKHQTWLTKAAHTALFSLVGAALAVAASIALTIVLSLVSCLGLHPEAAMAAEWAAPVIGLVWAGAVVRKAGRGASVGTGVVVALLWVLAWFYLLGRFVPRLWLAEGMLAISWVHVLSWISAPVFSAAGGMLKARVGSTRRFAGVLLHAAGPVVIGLIAVANLYLIDPQGDSAIAPGVSMSLTGPDSEGTTVRHFTFDFAANPRLRLGIYDRDTDDSTPFDGRTTSYYATPAQTVFERRGSGALLVINAGFFTWNVHDRVARHIAPVVLNGRAYYNWFKAPRKLMWTFGWKMVNGSPRFLLEKGLTFEEMPRRFDNALAFVRPLIIDGKPRELLPGPGVTRLRCSRTSLAWSDDSTKLHVLIVRDPDAEMASIADWKAKRRQVGGWDLPQIQKYWLSQGVRNAIVLDGGDSTQLVYKGTRGTAWVGSGRLSKTLGYLRDRPIRLWIPMLPVRHCDTGTINFIYVEQGR